MRTFFRYLFAVSFLFCLIASSYFASNTSVAQAFGISPPTLKINVSRGTRVTAEVLLQKDVEDLNKDVNIRVLTSNDPIGIVTLEGDSFVIPAGQLSRNYLVKALISEDVPNGEHRVKVVFLYDVAVAQGGSGGASSSLRRQLPVILMLTVDGQQVTAIEFISAKIPPLEVDDLMLLEAEFKNTGNVTWKPDAVVVRIYRSEDPNTLVFEYRAPVTSYIDPSNVFVYNLEFPHTLPMGRYVGRAFAVEAGVLTQERPIGPFDVLAPDTLAKKLEVISLTPNKVEYYFDEQQTVEVAVLNTGAVRTSMTVTTSLYKDGILISAQTSEPQFVEKGETSLTRVVFKDLAAGNYEVRAYADYAGKTTAVFTRTFVVTARPVEVAPAVKEPGAISALPGVVAGEAMRSLAWFQLSMCLCIPYWLILLILLLLLIAYLLYRYLRRRWNEVIEEHVSEVRKEQHELNAKPVVPVVMVQPPAPVQAPVPTPVPPQPTNTQSPTLTQPLPPIQVDTKSHDGDNDSLNT